MASVTHDDGFHEIQLNGKQLVFLFMAVTVVSVVIFLCGVLVGRGVRLDRGVAEAVSAEANPEAEPPVTTEAGVAPIGKPTAGDEKLGYPTSLESDKTPPERIEPPSVKLEPVPEPTAQPAATAENTRDTAAAGVSTSAPPAAAPSASAAASAAQPSPSTAPSAAQPSASSAPSAAQPSASSAAPAEPSGPGLAVQVAAYRVRGEADALAQRLIGKSYKAYVVPPAPGAPPLFRVRVGKFKEQREADQVVAKLKKEERFEPWIVR